MRSKIFLVLLLVSGSLAVWKMPKTARERAIQPINREVYEPNGKTVVHISKGDEEVNEI